MARSYTNPKTLTPDDGLVTLRLADLQAMENVKTQHQGRRKAEANLGDHVVIELEPLRALIALKRMWTHIGIVVAAIYTATVYQYAV